MELLKNMKKIVIIISGIKIIFIENFTMWRSFK